MTALLTVNSALRQSRSIIARVQSRRERL